MCHVAGCYYKWMSQEPIHDIFSREHIPGFTDGAFEVMNADDEAPVTINK